MIEHRPWVGSNYSQGLGGKKVAIIGNSHWGDEDDHPEATIECILHVIGEMDPWRIAFFNNIKNYFGETDSKQFWHKVMFFNYVPEVIGGGDSRYAQMSSAQAEAAKVRIKRIASDHRPDMMLLFTKKVRWALPELHLQSFAAPLEDVWRGHIDRSDEQTTDIFLLRHPQGASKEKMSQTVAEIVRSTTSR